MLESCSHYALYVTNEEVRFHYCLQLGGDRRDHPKWPSKRLSD